MIRFFMTATLLMLFATQSPQASAGSGTQIACIAIICLSGDGGSACAPSLSTFFKIEKFTGGLGGGFSKTLTKIARKKFLKQCDAPGIDGVINEVIKKNGEKQVLPPSPLPNTKPKRTPKELCEPGRGIQCK